MKLTVPLKEEPRLVIQLKKAVHPKKLRKPKKRGGSYSGLRKAVRTTGVGPNGHRHEYDTDLEEGFTSLDDGHRHFYHVEEDGSFDIEEADGHTHSEGA